MNKLILLGRLTRNPDIRYTQGAEPMAVARFTVAVDRKTRKQDGQQSADFIPCTAFGKTAEFVEKYLCQGTKILLEGKMTSGSYKDRGGHNVYTLECTVETIEFAESKSTGQQANGQQMSRDGFMNIPDNADDDLPFN